MQDILRRAFRMSFEHLEKQQNLIAELSKEVTVLKGQMSEKIAVNEVTRIVDSKMISQIRVATIDDVSTLRAQLVEFRASLERKASVRFVEDSLSRKLNKSDYIVNRNSNPPQDHLQTIEEFKTLVFKIDQRNARLEAIIKNDAAAVQESIQDIYKSLVSKVEKKDLEQSLSLKVSPTLCSSKAVSSLFLRSTGVSVKTDLKRRQIGLLLKR
jgi:hypothetical protein